MATLRDFALAAYNAKAAEWVAKGQERLRPVFTDAKGLQLDPIGKTEDVHHDREHGLLVLHTLDGSDLHFAVYPDDDAKPVTMVEPADGGGWTGYGGTGNPGPAVASPADVGAVLAGEV